MDKKILRNGRGRQRIADALYADHDISLKKYNHIMKENREDTALLLQADRSYDQKHPKMKKGVVGMLKEHGMI